MFPRLQFSLLFPAGPSVFREGSPRPKLRALALIWSLKCESTTGLLTVVKRKPSGRSSLWMPFQCRLTASTPCCHTAHHIIPRPALHLQVRCQQYPECSFVTFWGVILKQLRRSALYYSLKYKLWEAKHQILAHKAYMQKGHLSPLMWKSCQSRLQKHSWCDQRGRERRDKWSMSVSEWAEQMPLLFWSLKTHWEQSTLYLQSPLQSQHGEAWHKGQQSCDRPGSGQGQGGGTDTSRLANITLSFPHFLATRRLLMTLLRELPKQGNALQLLWPFHPDLMFAFRVISIDWVYLVYTT